MTRLRSFATVATAAVALALTGCGAVPPTMANAPAHWYPSTPLPTPAAVVPGQPSGTPAAQPSGPPEVGQAQTNGLGTPAQSVAATADLKFTPDPVSLKNGDVVEWKNTGSVPHNVTFDSQQSLSSGTLAQNETWQVKFTTAGTYMYRCTFHPNMNGQITVGG